MPPLSSSVSLNRSIFESTVIFFHFIDPFSVTTDFYQLLNHFFSSLPSSSSHTPHIFFLHTLKFQLIFSFIFPARFLVLITAIRRYEFLLRVIYSFSIMPHFLSSYLPRYKVPSYFPLPLS